jgi:hypothetical protein
MKEIFLITGLPRSRTAWLSNFLTIPGQTFCYHELRRWELTVPEMADRLMRRPERYVGTADSALPFYINELMEHLPQAKIIIIDRDDGIVFDSMIAAFGQEFATESGKLLDLTGEALLELKAAFRHTVVKYNDLDKFDTCREIWNACCPLLEFDNDRWAMLDEFKVEVLTLKYMRNVSLPILQAIRKMIFGNWEPKNKAVK